MFKKFLVVATLAAGLISTQANAAFVPTDWKVEGDTLATLDTATGLEWLDLTQTGGKSINEVKSLLGTVYEGWRLPTYDEMQTLASTLFPVVSNDPSFRYREFSVPGENAQSHVVFGSNVTGYTYGTYEKDNLTFMFGSKTTTNRLFFNYQLGVDLNYKRYYEGVYLVSDGGTTLSSIKDPTLNINNPNAPINMADVSAPAGVAAAGLMALMLGFRRKKGIGYV